MSIFKETESTKLRHPLNCLQKCLRLCQSEKISKLKYFSMTMNKQYLGCCHDDIKTTKLIWNQNLVPVSSDENSVFIKNIIIDEFQLNSLTDLNIDIILITHTTIDTYFNFQHF